MLYNNLSISWYYEWKITAVVIMDSVSLYSTPLFLALSPIRVAERVAHPHPSTDAVNNTESVETRVPIKHYDACIRNRWLCWAVSDADRHSVQPVEERLQHFHLGEFQNASGGVRWRFCF